jgi:hypothetical protein
VDKRRFETQFRPAGTRLIGLIVCLVAVHAAAFSTMTLGLSPAKSALILISALALITATIMGTRQPQIEVGADGILFHHKLREEFVRHEDVTEADLTADLRTLTIHAAGQQHRMAIPVGHRKEAVALHRRIQRARAAHAREPMAPARLALLGRGSRTMQAWRAELATLLHREAGFRRSPLSRDDLEAILASPATHPEHRVAAAMALQAAEGEDNASQIRIAAESCAEHGARLALQRIADEDYEHASIEAALTAEQEIRQEVS